MELERIMAALRRAHAAGDTAAATRLAAMARAASEAQSTDLSAQGGNLYSQQNAGMFNAGGPVDFEDDIPFAPLWLQCQRMLHCI